MLTEADDVLDEDLEACSEHYQNILNEALPQYQAAKLAREHYGIELDDKTLNSILQHFACTPSPLHKCVEDGLRNAGLL